MGKTDFFKTTKRKEELATEVQKEVDAKMGNIQTTNDKENNRVTALLASVGSIKVAEILKKIEPLVDLITKVANTVYPPLQKGIDYGIMVYNKLPVDILLAILGLLLCFFGGTFAITIAALEAFYYGGFETFKTNLLSLYYEFMILWKKSREDDLVDADGDGTADVKQITARELFTRKISLYFSTCRDPAKIMGLTGDLIRCLMGVIAVLKSEFAKVIALGTMIGENMRKPVSYLVVPTVSTVLPEKFHQWIAPTINYGCKLVAIWVAWFIQRIISSVQSAIRGGLMFSRRSLKYLNDQGYIKFNDEESYLDEILGWSVAALGIYFQLVNFFGIPFPLNIILCPISFVEETLIWLTN
jgi:hypothetical protein